ncbi:MAG: nucleotidyl transferase AbiEii/AbiGii toxin family protein [Chloroflexi bacterium]|nr:nucleotidyl transferase AbiEii/AbiGii toxin family protein [Chloroflexota bacterium]
MKDYLATIVRSTIDPAQGRNLTREYLQARILAALQSAGAMLPLAFHGGTALRFLFTISRYSEDLDFALERPSKEYDFRKYLRAVQTELSAEGYQIEIKVSDSKVVQSAFVRFVGLLYELGLSPHRDEILAVKLEVDTNPPAGATTTTTIVRRYVTLQLQHHDKASLLAGKLHAVLQRPYAKGRDLYDLLWYLSDPSWPLPNFTMLNNALLQTGWRNTPLTAENWQQAVRTRLQTLRWDQLQLDVSPFLERTADLQLLTLDNLLRVLQDKD